jgi:hypothetical protein
MTKKSQLIYIQQQGKEVLVTHQRQDIRILRTGVAACQELSHRWEESVSDMERV